MASAGQFKEIITIYKRTLEKNEYGQEQENYLPYQTTRAKVTYRSGNKTVENDEIVQIYTKTFTIHYYIKIVSTDRIKWNGEYYRILSIDKQQPYNQIVVETEVINE